MKVNGTAVRIYVNFGAGNSKYCSEAANAARADLITSDSWAIKDGGRECPPPADPSSAPDLTPASDTGVSNSDNITSNNTPDFYVECSDVGNTITLYTNNPAANTTAGSHVCVTVGTETASVTQGLSSGVHHITYTDQNGIGESGHSPSLNVTIELPDLIFKHGFEASDQ